MTRALCDGDAGLVGEAGGEGLVGVGEAARVAPFDGAQKADHLVGDDDRHVHHGALAARDHLGPLLGRQLEVVVVGRGDAALGRGSGAGADVAQPVDAPGRDGRRVVVCLVASDDLDRARDFVAHQDVALLDLEALGQAPRDVDQGAFGGVPPDADSAPVARSGRPLVAPRSPITPGRFVAPRWLNAPGSPPAPGSRRSSHGDRPTDGRYLAKACDAATA